MPAGPTQQMRRAFVTVLLAVAAVYNVVLLLTRDSSDAELVSGYRKVIKKAHPDKGGSAEEFRRLQTAKENWDHAKSHGSSGRARAGSGNWEEQQGRRGGGGGVRGGRGRGARPQGHRHNDARQHAGLGHENLEVAGPEEIKRAYRSWECYRPNQGTCLLQSAGMLAVLWSLLSV